MILTVLGGGLPNVSLWVCVCVVNYHNTKEKTAFPCMKFCRIVPV